MARNRRGAYPAPAEECPAQPSEQTLEELERLPLAAVTETWPRPRMTDAIEGFASPADVGRALAGLHAPGGPEVASRGLADVRGAVHLLVS